MTEPPNNHPNSCDCIECAEYRRTLCRAEAIGQSRVAGHSPPQTRTFDVGQFPELGAMLTIHDVLEPRTASQRARVLGAAALLSCPNAFSDEQWLNLIHEAQRP